MIRLIRFTLLCCVKLLCRLFYRYDLTFLSDEHFSAFPQVKVVAFLNHTSLFEPLFLGLVPISILWRLSGDDLLIPGADITLDDRAIVGKIYHALLPGLVSITRKKDHSWAHFMGMVDEEKLVIILPEGRMKRRSGLDKFGKQMTVRGGIADILKQKQNGKICFVYSGGLHHVQAPGDKKIKLFKTIRANAEIMDIAVYKKSLPFEFGHDYREEVVADMQKRLKTHVPPNMGNADKHV